MTSFAPIDDSADLIRHIESCYHARHRKRFAELVKLAEMIEDLHDGDEGRPEGLTDILRRMTGTLEAYMKRAELTLFPAIRKGGMPGIGQQIAVMRADHDGFGRDIAQIHEITAGFTLPDTACTSWETLYAGVAAFVGDLAEHMRLEDEVLFARFERAGVAHV